MKAKIDCLNLRCNAHACFCHRLVCVSTLGRHGVIYPQGDQTKNEKNVAQREEQGRRPQATYPLLPRRDLTGGAVPGRLTIGLRPRTSGDRMRRDHGDLLLRHGIDLAATDVIAARARRVQPIAVVDHLDPTRVLLMVDLHDWAGGGGGGGSSCVWTGLRRRYRFGPGVWACQQRLFGLSGGNKSLVCRRALTWPCLVHCLRRGGTRSCKHLERVYQLLHE